MRLQGIVQKVQGCPECRVSDRPAVSFHRGRHLYNELGAFRLFRRVADTRRHELYLFYLQQVIHHRVMRLDGQEQYHRKPVYRLRESGV